MGEPDTARSGGDDEWEVRTHRSQESSATSGCCHEEKGARAFSRSLYGRYRLLTECRCMAKGRSTT